MKNTLFVLLMISLFGCADHHSFITTGLEGKAMPSFNLLLADSVTRFSTSAMPAGKPAVLFFFQPWCPYCKAQTEDMLKHMQAMKDIHFYLLTTAPYPLFKQFYDKYALNKYPNITAGIDTSFLSIMYFHAPGVPYQAVYDRKGKLKRALIGPSDMNLIKNIALD
jgi:thiol-disulfide isomerase/thioredoxin